jgi:RNA polymerase-interacting CarD/CdnL/TRCF family regulator
MAPRIKSKYKIGEWLVHHQFGVGEIKDIVEKGLDEDRKTFYKVQTKKNTYWLPVGEENTDRVEPLRHKKNFKSMLEILAAKPEKIATNHKSRQKEIQERWNEGSLESRTRLMRDLNGRLNRKTLNFNERQTLKRIRTQFIDEWLLVDSNLDRKEAKKRVQEALNESAQKDRKRKD